MVIFGLIEFLRAAALRGTCTINGYLRLCDGPCQTEITARWCGGVEK